MITNKIGIASDHAGYALKQHVISYLKENGFEIKDYGCFSEESCDYPDFAHLLANAVEDNTYKYGIAICGSGEGMAMSLNKHQKIRAALCWLKEIAALSRQHNNANILVMPGRFISEEVSDDIVKTFFTTEFEGGRHLRRINKIPISKL